MSISLQSNRSAMAASRSLTTAAMRIQESSSRLSSGQKQAWNDVAAYAVGKILETNNTTLRSAEMNASGAQNLLGVAEGAVGDIASMLQRQKALASSATSGTLTDVERGYYNQEFQGLVAQINQVAQSTNFNGIKLLNGNLFSPVEINTDTRSTAVKASATMTLATAQTGQAASTAGYALADKTLSINGVDFAFRIAARMTEGSSYLNVNTTANTTPAQQVSAIESLVANIRTYTGTDAHILDAKSRLNEVDLSFSGSDITVTARSAGARGNKIQVGGYAMAAAGDLTVNGTNAGTNPVDLATATRGVYGVNGALNAGMESDLTTSFTLYMNTAVVTADDDDAINFSDGTNTISFTIQKTADLATTGYDASMLEIEATGTAAQQLTVIKNKIENLKTYNGATTANINARNFFRNFDVTLDTTNNALRFTSKVHGTAINAYTIGLTDGDASIAAGDLTINNTNVGTTSVPLANQYRGTYVTNNLLDEGKVFGFKASGTLSLATALAVGDADDLGSTISINGATFTTRNTAGMSTGTAILNINIETNTTAATQMVALKTAIDNVLAYNGTDSTTLAAQKALSKLSFDLDATNGLLRITSNKTGSAGNDITIVRNSSTGGSMTGNWSLDGERYGVATGSVSKNLATLTRGTYVYDQAKTFAHGIMKDSLLADFNEGDYTTTGLGLANVSNNAGFVGTLENFKVEYANQEDRVNISVVMGTETYRAQNIATNQAADTTVTFNSDTGGSFFIRLKGGSGQAVSESDPQTGVDLFEARLNKALSGITVYQRRTMSSYLAAGEIVPEGQTVSTGDLSGTTMELISNKFGKMRIDKLDVEAPVGSSTDAAITMIIDGTTYKSGTGVGTSLLSQQKLVLTSIDNVYDQVIFTNGATDLSFANSSEALALEKALKASFNLDADNGNSSILFQIGTTSDQVIEVSLESAATNNIYLDDAGNDVLLDLSTQEKAIQASDVLDKAIRRVTSFQATIGALQNRFEYAISSIKTTIENQEAARASNIDTDISAESTTYSKWQVLQQISVSMLRQANQLPQSLLALVQ